MLYISPPLLCHSYFHSMPCFLLSESFPFTSFKLVPTSWDLSVLIHLLRIFLVLVSWWKPCAHTEAEPLWLLQLSCVTALGVWAMPCFSAPRPASPAGSLILLWPAQAGIGIECGCSAVPPWVGKPKLHPRRIFPSLFQRKICRTSIYIITRWEIPALVNPAVITQSCELLWIPATDSSISTQLLF